MREKRVNYSRLKSKACPSKFRLHGSMSNGGTIGQLTVALNDIYIVMDHILQKFEIFTTVKPFLLVNQFVPLVDCINILTEKPCNAMF